MPERQGDNMRPTPEPGPRTCSAPKRSSKQRPFDDGDETEPGDGARLDPSPVDPRGVPETLGRFDVVKRLGAGAMGVVYLARDNELDRSVAIKLLRQRGEESTAQARLLREAKSLARLRHPNVVAVHELGSHGEQVFVAMEYVEGGSLRDWLKAAPRSVDEILEMFAQAAGGLAAAHEAGIVHRDFKPENVLVGADGRARVADFGLAQGSTEPDSVHATTRDRPAVTLEQSLTRSGVIVGTPAYMAPELYGGKPATAASDQFSFCISLHEALFGVRPFRGGTIAELAAAILSGNPSAPEASGRAPRFIRKAIERGLEASPGRRWPSLRALQRELRRGPTRKRRLFVAALVPATMLATTLALWPWELPCAEAGEGVAATWGPSQRANVRQALGQGPDTAPSSVEIALDGYAAAWTEAAAAACEAHEVRGEQSAQMQERRMACLERGRAELETLLEVLAEPRDTKAIIAERAASSLPDPAGCADLNILTSLLPLPTDATRRTPVIEARRTLARVRALLNTGHVAAANELYASMAEDASDLDFPPLTAELALQDATHASILGHSADTASALKTAFSEAQRGGDTRTAAAAAVMGIATAASLGDREGARRWAWLALPLVQRAEREPGLRAAYWGNLAIVEAGDGNLAAAVAAFEKAERGYIEAFGPDEPKVADAMYNRAVILRRQGHVDEAMTVLLRADALFRRKYGDDSPLRAGIANSLGAIAMSRNQLHLAEEHFERSLRLYDKGRSKPHPVGGHPLNNLGELNAARGDHEAAIEFYDRALARWEPLYGGTHPNVGEAVQQRGFSELALGRYADAANSLGRAVAIVEAGPDEVSAKLRDALKRAAAGASGAAIEPRERAPKLAATGAR